MKKHLKSSSRFSRSKLSLFILAFAAIGTVIYISLAAPNPNLPGDLNSDNTVNISDLSILLSNYGTSNAAADINGDGLVNILDLSALLSHYGSTLNVATGSLWGSTSPVNTLIPDNPQVLVNYNSGPIVGVTGIGFNSNGWGVAMFDDQAGRTRVTMTSAEGWTVDNVPLPSQLDAYVNAMAVIGDGERHMNIVDGGKVWNLYGMNKNSTGQWAPAAEGVLRVGGSGVWSNSLGPWLGRASGFADGFGVVRKAEVDSGTVNHALTVAWPKNHITSPSIANSVVSPANTSDGSCTSNCAPMGSRIQLDPTLTDSQLISMGISSYYLPVAHAMQKYGAYIADSSSWMTIFAESWNNNGKLPWPNGWAPITSIMTHIRIVQPPPAPVLDDRTIFGEPHK